MTIDIEAYRAMSIADRCRTYAGARTDAERQALLELGVQLHSTEAGARQPGLEYALTEDELATGGGYTPAITSVDCTPRPRYGESRAKFEARMAGYRREAGLVQREVDQRNRAAALRVVLADGKVSKWYEVERDVELGRLQAVAYFTRCACGFCGVRVQDPEVARREYDAHPCAAANVGQDAVDRAQAHAGKATMPAKRKAVLLPAFEEQRNVAPHHTERQAAGDLVEKEQADEHVDEEHVDEAVARFALLEIG